MSDTVSLAEYLAAFAVSGVVPTTDSEDMLCLSLFDWAVCGIAGAGEPVARITRETALFEGGRESCSVIASTRRLPPRAAALVNGTTSHALDYDDTHFAHIGHPSVAVIPAALAAAEAAGASLPDMRHAALLGVEASVRTGLWLGRDHYQVGFHQTATAGAIGATVAAARLFDLSKGEATMALGLAGTRASGLKSQFGTMGKPYNAGLAAANGVEVALLARAGFAAATDGLDGPQGFGPTHHGAGDDSAFDGTGTVWLFEGVSHKFHACCHGLHAMLEALASLNLSAGAVEELSILVHPRWSTVCNIEAPETGLEAKFSYRQTAAMALCGVPTSALAAYSEKTIRDPRIVALRDRIQVGFDDNVPETAARVAATLTEGAVRRADHDLMAPMTMQARADRLRTKATALLGGDLAGALWDAAHGQRLDDFTDLLRA